MNVLIVGGGPGGLYLALLLKREHPTFDVTVVERDRRGVTFGWGVVFSDDAVEFLRESDPASGQALSNQFSRWKEIEVCNRGQTIICSGHLFAATGRPALLRALQARCEELGVRLRFESTVQNRAQLDGYDLVVAADGVRSKVRDLVAGGFSPTISPSRNRYVWFGTRRRFERFTAIFRENQHGIFWVYAYPFDDELATFNIECNDSTFRRSGLERASEAESIAYCERVFADDLDGQPLLANRSTWNHFYNVTNPNWSSGNVVLLGDAAHTTHFTVGSGTKLAMEDAVALARALDGHERLGDALVAYERSRRGRVERIQAAANQSVRWFERVSRYVGLDPLQLAGSFFTRSGRVGYANLKLRDPAFGRRIDERLGDVPRRSRLALRELELAGRVVLRSSPAAPSTSPSMERHALEGAAAILVPLDGLDAVKLERDASAHTLKLLVEVPRSSDVMAALRAGADAIVLDSATWPLEAIRAAREAIGGATPLLAQLGAEADLVSVARALKQQGCDALVTGSLEASDCVRNEVPIPVMVLADGADSDEIDTAIMAGRADLVAVNRLAIREESI